MCSMPTLPTKSGLKNFYRSEWNSKRGETVSMEMTPGTSVKDTAARMLLHAGIEDRAATILEIGCGTGDMLAGLQQRGFNNLYGTEASDYRAAKTELRFPGRAFRGGYSAVPPGLEFDFIFSHHVMEHVYNPHQAMRWMTDRLRPGGLIAVTVPQLTDRAGAQSATVCPASPFLLAPLTSEYGQEPGLWLYFLERCQYAVRDHGVVLPKVRGAYIQRNPLG